MKKVKKSSKYEPTITDVLDAVQTGFSRHEGILSRHETLLIELQTGFARHDKMFATLHEGQENFRDQLKDFDRRLINTQNRVEDIADNLESVVHVSTKDKLSILDHERRIQHLEKARA